MMTGEKPDKSEIRKAFGDKIRAMSPAERAWQSRTLCERLGDHPKIGRAKRLGVYLALPDEPDLAPLMRVLLEREVRLFLPVPEGASGWGFRAVRALGPLRPGILGLPFPPLGVAAGVEELDAVLVPGRAFTDAGHRLGRGKGIYDRLLSGCGERGIGVAFACQQAEWLPVEAHDVRLGAVVFGGVGNSTTEHTDFH